MHGEHHGECGQHLLTQVAGLVGSGHSGTVAQGSWALSDDGITKEFCCSINLLQKSFLAILHTWIMLGIQQEKMSHQVIATGEQGVNYLGAALEELRR